MGQKKGLNMGFQNKNMSVVAYANGFTLWHYVSKDEKLKDICKLGYFNRIITLANTGDIVIINGSDSTGIKYMELVGDDIWIRDLK